MVLACTQCQEVENNDIWYLDTGCSNHMIGKMEFSISLMNQLREK